VGNNATGDMTVDGGTLAVDGWIDIGRGASGDATLNMISGTINASNLFLAENGGSGTLNMTGGTIIFRGILMLGRSGPGHVNLNGGVITTNDFNMGLDTGGVGTMDIAAGKLVINGDKLSLVQGYIDNGWITAYEKNGKSDGKLNLDYDNESNQTTLSAIHNLNPNPVDGGIALPGEVELSWTLPDPCVPGQPVLVDVYFTDDYDALNDFTNPDAIRIVSQQNVTSVVVQTQPKTRYYWAVDTYIGDPNDPILGPIFSFYADNGFPEFSWDDVPLYAHLGIGDGLEPNQCNYLADHYDLITFTGGIVRDGLSVEPKIAAAASAIKQRNPKTKVLFYWASDKPKHQWKLSNATYPGDYLLSTKNNKTTKYLDLTRQDVRDWWTDIAAQAVTTYACDGIFVDGATAGRPGGPLSRDLGKETAAVMDDAIFEMLIDAKQKMGPDKLILFNPLHGYEGNEPPLGEPYLPVADGAMIDDFDRAANIRQQSVEYMANTIKIMRRAAKDGNIIVFKTWPGFTWWSDEEMMKKPHDEIHRVASERITFPLACFLVGAEPNCYFCYTWGWLGEYGTFDWYPEFDMPLGPPKGEATQNGWTFYREFDRASVFVDLETKAAEINWR